MRLINLLLAFVLISSVTVAQEENFLLTQEFEVKDTIKKVEQDTTLTLKKEHKSQEKDTTKIRLGKREIVIIEKDGATTIEIPDTGDKFSIDSNKDKNFTYKRNPRFKGHWAGIEWGFNGYTDANQSINMLGDYKYLELKQGRSWNFNVNFMQYSLGFGTDKVGLLTGLGLEFNNYHFRNETTLKIDNGITVYDDSYALDLTLTVTQSKFQMTYLTAPLLVEFQIPTSSRHRIFISAGIVGGVHLCSSTAVKYEGVSNGKNKLRSDFNLAPFRYGYTARLGFRGISLFATYYPVQLFEKTKGPELYPFAIGLRLINFAGS